VCEEAACECLLEAGHSREGRGVWEVEVSESHDGDLVVRISSAYEVLFSVIHCRVEGWAIRFPSELEGQDFELRRSWELSDKISHELRRPIRS